MNTKKISILVFNMSSNAIVRTYPIAKTLSRIYSVEIIGPDFGDGVFEPYKDEFNYKVIKVDASKGRIVAFFNLAREMLSSIEGDVVYAFKPRLTSFGIGLLAKLRYGKPLILDMDDYETANLVKRGFFSLFLGLFSRFDLNNETVNYFLEKMIAYADTTIVVSSYLWDKFGGSILVHGVDVSFFDPDKFDSSTSRDRCCLEHDLKYILFSGVPREHKGVKDLLRAIINLDRKDVRLLIVGVDADNQYYKDLLHLGGGIIVPVKGKPHDEMPFYLSASDIVALPQRDTEFARAQIPAKVFEAMAMAKPIISTNVSDLSEILHDCGLVIEPSDSVKELEEALQLLLDDEVLSKSLGKKARQKCIHEYSWDEMSKKLVSIFDQYMPI